MSPIPSVATPFTLLPPAPSISLVPDPPGQSASVTSPHILGTGGGLLFAVVAIVSVVGYFYRGRSSANRARTNNTWTSLTSLLSSIGRRGPSTTSATVATDWPSDVEMNVEQHVSMVYARFFHPTFWNLVECHPGTISAPAIYVEDEANEIPLSGSTPPGMNSYLDMDGDDNEDGDRDGADNVKRAHEKQDAGEMAKKVVPPYGTSSRVNINFTSKIIGTTVRAGGFLSVLDEYGDQDQSSKSSSTDFVSVQEEADNGISESSSSDCECDFCCSTNDGVATSPLRLSSSARSYGMAGAGHLSQNFEDPIPEEGYDLVPTISCRTGLVDILKSTEVDPVVSYRSLEQVDRTDNKPATSNRAIGVHDRHRDLGDSQSDTDMPGGPHEGVGLTSEVTGTTLHSGALLPVSNEAHDDLSEILLFDSEFDLSRLAYDGIVMSPPRPSSRTRRYGMASVADLSQSLKDMTPQEAYKFPRTGLVDVPKLADPGPAMSYKHLEQVDPVDNRLATSNRAIGVHDSCDDLQDCQDDTNIPAGPHGGMDFTREIIGMTVLLDAFPSVPGESRDDLSEVSLFDSEFDLSRLAYDGIVMSPPRPSSRTRRYGMASVADLSQSFKDPIPEGGYDVLRAISRRAGLVDVPKLSDVGPAMSCRSLEHVEPVDEEQTASNCDTGVRDSRNEFRGGWSDADIPPGHHESMDLTNKTIGTTLRPGTLESISDEHAEYSSGTSLSKPVSIPGEAHNYCSENSSSNSEFDLSYPAAYHIATPAPGPSSGTRGHRISELAYLSQGFKDTILEEADDLIPMISRPTRLPEISKLSDVDLPVEHVHPVDSKQATLNRDISAHDDRGGLRSSQSDADTPGGPYNWAMDLTNEIIGTLRSGALPSIPEEAYNEMSENSSSDSEFDLSCSAYDGIAMSLPRSSSDARRHGMANVAFLSQSFKDMILEERYDILAISPQTALLDVSKLSEVDPAMSSRSLEQTCTVDDQPVILNCDIGAYDSSDESRDNWTDVDSYPAPHVGMDIMRRLLAELRDPALDCTPRALSEDSESEYCDNDNDNDNDNDDDDDQTIPRVTPMWRLDNARRNSLESTSSASSTPRTDPDPDLSDGPIYPLTPPAKHGSSVFCVPDVHNPRTTPPAPPWLMGEVQVASPTLSYSPPSLPTKAYVCTHRNGHSLLYGPRLPLLALPPL